MTKLEELIARHEGLRLKPYKCSAGKLTIGYGRNLDDVGITEQEAKILLTHDIEDARRDCLLTFPFFIDLDQVRKDALVDMCFNLGIAGLKKFKKMLQAIDDKDYHRAALEALDSKWAKQVGRRAEDIVYMIIEGKYND